VQPLPAPGRLAFVCAWPGRGIRAFPAGFGFTLNLRLRNLHPWDRRGLWPSPAWPARGIPSSRVEVDGVAILRAAEAAVRLWSDDLYCAAD
jgi:hypothetical protein